MSGFKEDIISILRDNVMLNREALGLIYGSNRNYRELYDELVKLKLPVTMKITKPVVLYSYIVLSASAGMNRLLEALASLASLGLIIIELDFTTEDLFSNSYRSLFAGFTATKVKYQDRAYIVIHAGVDYGN